MSSAPDINDRLVAQVCQAAKAYGEHRLFADLNVEMRQGEVLAMVGPSGAGKTTILRCLAGLTPLDTGTILIQGTELGQRKNSYWSVKTIARGCVNPRVGYVPQGIDLWPDRTLKANIALARRYVLRTTARDAEDHAERLLERFGLSGKAQSYPDSLSGGEQQRGALCRALAVDPALLLLDEITSALDPEHVSEVLDCVRDLAIEGRTMVLVTHHIGFARSIANAILFMDGAGHHTVTGTESFFARPPSARAATFLETCRSFSV
jgi:ABC-type polar amino acid transport system ATPase subunit